MDGVAEAEQEFGEIGAVLPGDAGQQRHAPFRILRHHVHSNKGAATAQTQFTADQTAGIAPGRPVTCSPVDFRPNEPKLVT